MVLPTILKAEEDMRVNRSKFVRKYLRFFRVNFQVVPRFNIILDGNFIYSALKYKIDIRERLQKLLQADEEPRLFVLKSSVAELESMGDKATESLTFTKSFCEIMNDGSFAKDDDETVSRVTSFMKSLSMESWHSSNARRYMFATQDKELRSYVGHIPGIPLIYLNKVIMVLEPPSHASLKFNKHVELKKSGLKTSEFELVSSVKSVNSKVIGVQVEHKERKKRKATGANPLSVKKKDEYSKSSKKKKKERVKLGFKK